MWIRGRSLLAVATGRKWRRPQQEMGRAARDEVSGVARHQIARHHPGGGVRSSPQGRGRPEGNGDNGQRAQLREAL